MNHNVDANKKVEFEKTITAVMQYLDVYKQHGQHDRVWFESHLRDQIKYLLNWRKL